MKAPHDAPPARHPHWTQAAVTSPDVLADEELYNERLYAPRAPSSVRRYQPAQSVTASPVPIRTHIQVTRHAIPQRATAQRPARQQPLPLAHPSRRQQSVPRLHWLTWVGVGMVVMLLGWLLITLVATWWNSYQDDLHYGHPRTFQIDAVVGHHDSPAHPSHFIAQHLGTHYYVIELAGGDPTNVRVILPMTDIGPGGDLTPITLQFQDVNHDGRPDMLVQVGTTRMIFINEHGTFRPAKPGEVTGM
ncbi:MAG TPA: hypothetical protein VKY19_26380 [Ktedonosporobacter sp.]|jgi:hypothetical protein|nr:hypothetical protein [Ktedonosporobacter sp.]